MKRIFEFWTKTSLILRIAVGIVVGAALALFGFFVSWHYTGGADFTAGGAAIAAAGPLQLAAALRAVELQLTDHIIVAGEEYLSMSECGYFERK